MPLPTPNSGESKNDFIGRCVSNSTVRSDFSSDEQIVAVCERQWSGSKYDDEKIETRHIGFDLDTKAMNEEKDGTIIGYGAVFGNLDSHKDIIKQGAFKSSLEKKNSNDVAMLWQHKSDTPIGVWESIYEDQHGLRMKGRIITESDQGRNAYALIKGGAVKGLSIGYRVYKDGASWKKTHRELKSLDLMEVSIVTMPSNEQALVTGVKEFATVREMERHLRDVSDLSNTDAKVAASAVMKAREGKNNPIQWDAGEDDMISVPRGLLESIIAKHRQNS